MSQSCVTTWNYCEITSLPSLRNGLGNPSITKYPKRKFYLWVRGRNHIRFRGWDQRRFLFVWFRKQGKYNIFILQSYSYIKKLTRDIIAENSKANNNFFLKGWRHLLHWCQPLSKHSWAYQSFVYTKSNTSKSIYKSPGY